LANNVYDFEDIILDYDNTKHVSIVPENILLMGSKIWIISCKILLTSCVILITKYGFDNAIEDSRLNRRDFDNVVWDVW